MRLQICLLGLLGLLGLIPQVQERASWCSPVQTAAGPCTPAFTRCGYN